MCNVMTYGLDWQIIYISHNARELVSQLIISLNLFVSSILLNHPIESVVATKFLN